MPDCAVAIGICRYPFLDRLDGPENDANDFAKWLTEEATPRLDQRNVCKILSSNFRVSREPTTQQIDDAFEDILQLPRNGDGVIGDRLYIFMSGHGFAPNLEDAALLMANAAKGRTGYHIPGRPYANWFRAAYCFKEVVLFMDCCRENYPRAPIKNPPWDLQAAPSVSRRFYGFATEWSRESWETQVGTPPIYRGRFTLALMEGLRGGAADPVDQRITGTSLSEYVFNRLVDATTGAQQLQEPKFDLDPAADVVFSAGNPPPFTVRAACQPDGTAPSLEDGVFRPLPPTVKDPAYCLWKVYRGLYRLVRPDGTTTHIEFPRDGGIVNV